MPLDINTTVASQSVHVKIRSAVDVLQNMLNQPASQTSIYMLHSNQSLIKPLTFSVIWSLVYLLLYNCSVKGLSSV